MDQGKSPAGEEVTREPEEIRAEIEETRADLGDTAAALADKADVKKQAKAKVDDVKERVAGKAAELKEKASEATPDSARQGAGEAKRVVQENPVSLALLGAFVAGFALAKLLSR